MKNENEKDESKYKVEFLGEKFSKDLLTYKVNVLGLYGVGKTTIIHKLMNKEICNDYSPTISVDIANFQVKVNDKIIQIQIWDCCGNDEFALNTQKKKKNTSIAILIYAINNRKSFNNLELWHSMLLSNSFDHTIILVGNKNDLEKEREVTIEDAENFKNKYDDIKVFLEVSSKTGENIDKLLENIAISIYEKFENGEKNLEKPNTIKLGKENHRIKKKNKYC